MTVITGFLKGPFGDARADVTITMRAIKTSSTVILEASSRSTTDATGKYTLNVEPGQYDVLITASGSQPERVGSIQVFLDSVTGTLNDFLVRPAVEDLTPQIVATVDRMRADAAESAAAAKVSENNSVAAMSNALSKVVTTDQSVASTVLLTKPVRLSSAASITGFIPSSQGAWVSWNRKTATDDGLTGATDFINHKGTFNGGWHFWSTDGTSINLSTRINWDGSIKTMGGITSYTDQVMQAGNTAPNLLLRFRDKDGVEKGAVYSQTDTGVINFRWAGTTYTMQGRADGFVSVPKGHTIATALATPAAVVDAVSTISNSPVSFRGADAANFDVPNNYSIGTWYGFSVVPTISTVSPGVEQGKPVFYVNARTGVTYALNGLYVGSTPVLKTGDYGIGSTSPIGYTDANTVGVNQFFRMGTNIPNSPQQTAGWAGIAGGYDGYSRYQMVWSQGGTTVDLRTRVGKVANNVQTWSEWASFWHTLNTTVDTNGNIKKASPIIKLFGDGTSELNDQSQGVITGRISEGVYRVSGVLGFNGDGAWGGAGNGIEIPVDDNKRPIIWIESKVLPDGDIEIRTYHRTYDTGPYSTRNIDVMETDAIDSKGKVIKDQKIYVPIPDGTPIDIPAGRWIDLRVEMPASDEPEPIFEAEQEVTTEHEPEATTLGEEGAEQEVVDNSGDEKATDDTEQVSEDGQTSQQQE